jgi:3-hydroxyacyl-CoA dehydrogenase/enoyl-CoA hydratase/3-hydroxybutyryl-CoA epimerase
MSLNDGLKVELEVFTSLALSSVSKNLIGLFFTSEMLKKETFSTAKPKTIETSAVIGVGTMGSGIAWALLHKNIEVRLGARKMPSIAKSMSKIMQSFESIKKRGRLTSREIGLKMDKVTHTNSMQGLESVDIVIEAVSEDTDIKQKVFSDIEAVVRAESIIATNTSSLDISTLVATTQYPERFVGMHFFNPVQKMPLVEVIAGDKTSDETIATVVKLAKRLGKTPIRVKECAGFLVNRTLLPYLNESAKMFEEGENIEHIDKLLTDFGMPMGPFTLADEVGIDIGVKVSDILFSAYGKRMEPSNILTKMTNKEWLGKKTGTGFYTHKGRSKGHNEHIGELHTSNPTLDDTTILDRAILIMVNEAARCLEEDVVDNARYLDMAMVMGTGFPAFRGGLLRYADSQGIKNIVERLHHLQSLYGERFVPAEILVEMSEKEAKFYDTK